MYTIRLVDENENILLSVNVHNMDLSRRSDQKILCQQILEICQQKDDKQVEMDLSDG